MRLKKSLVFVGITTAIMLALISWYLFKELVSSFDPQVIYLSTRGYYMQTDIGYVWNSPPPWPEGNSFSLAAEPGDPSKCINHVVNMHAENFHDICIKLGLLRVRARILNDAIGNTYIIIIDPRIPRNWFLQAPCSHCMGVFGQQLLTDYSEWFRAR
ncbi:MAG TPA: hypothetical protein PLN21_08615 [Gemmatales bacterium]|nr:hypothetical protein [Gemmatales bacterium]